MADATTSRARMHDLVRLGRFRLAANGGAGLREASTSRRRAVTVTFLICSGTPAKAGLG